MVNRVSLALVALLALQACSKEACPKGQELREERFPNSTQVRSRGCVGQDKEGNYRLQGAWEFFYENGQKAEAGSYSDGNSSGEKNKRGTPMDGRVGLWVEWFRSGQKKSETKYQTEPRAVHSVEWHENGNKSSEFSSEKGLFVGTATTWYPNGQKEMEITFKNGSPFRQEMWTPEGKYLGAKTE